MKPGPGTDPDPGLMTKNLKTNTAQNCFISFFGPKIAISLPLGLLKGRPSVLKIEHPALLKYY